MIPTPGRALIDTHLEIARNTESGTFAELALSSVNAMLDFAVAVDFLTPAQYSNEITVLNLIRAQRKNAAARS